MKPAIEAGFFVPEIKCLQYGKHCNERPEKLAFTECRKWPFIVWGGVKVLGIYTRPYKPSESLLWGVGK